MRRPTGSRYARPSGFTLIEMMITVAIVGVLAAIALPSYSEYVMRGRLTDAHSKLGDLRAQMERYFLDNRTYEDPGGTSCGIDTIAIPVIANYNNDNGRSFDLDCVATPTTFTLRAVGLASKGTAGFTFTVNELNARKTTTVPTGWTTAPTCWVVRKSGECS